MEPLKGIITPMVTPLESSDKLDNKGLERLIEHVIKGGVYGLFILGTTGEAPSLSYRLRYELIEKTCKQVNGRIPVLVGITDTAFVESIKMANYAEEQGASGVVVAPPYYFPAGKDELAEYFCDLIKELSLPMYLYNMPSHTKMVIDPEIVVMAANLPGVHGLKDSSGNMVYFHTCRKLLKDKKDFSFFVGPEETLAETLFLGAEGGVNGGSNFYPELYVNIYNAAQKEDWETVRKLHDKVMQIRSTIYSVGRFGSSYLKGVKSALFNLGICSDFMAEPFHAFREKEQKKIREHLKAIFEK
jgi:dihydrodipicolinate synthase/N-acetylneuraminate lyase